MNADRVRLFVAVVPPRAILDDIADAVRPIRTGELRWADPAQWHVTLRFLGDTDVGPAVDALAELGGPGAEATIGPEVCELFPGVVGLPVAGLDALASRARAALAHLGASDADDARPFVGHLTLARSRSRSRSRSTPAVAPVPFRARFVVDEVLLVRSTLGADGAHHEPIARVGLSV